ncbi:MAG: Phospholipase precursor [Pseudomonadota bacterium]
MAAMDRRRFLSHSISASALVASGVSLSACSSKIELQPDFLYGVASGDPLADRVILWTHAKVAASDNPLTLDWEVATDNTFTSVVSRGIANAGPESGFTVKVDATGLQPGTDYFFRFRCNGSNSPVGRTRTLPVGTPSAVRLAVLSCSNYPAGYFNVYGAVASSDAQYAVHLGDYIYEYAANGYASASAASLGRVSVPANETISLADYRARYAQYRTDPDAKVLHARMPFIAVWDDHELANNAWKDGAENHNPVTEGSYAARRAAAQQAYHEWMPIRTGNDRGVIYRSFNFGTLLTLHMLDTRSIGRDQQIEVTALLNPATAAQAQASFASPNRQLLGTAQLQWLQSGLAQSTATWQVLGQQVLMSRMEFPATILQALNPSNTSPDAQAAGQVAINNYLTAKGKRAAGAALSASEAALLDTRVNPKLGYNLDAWDGYVAARETVLMTALQQRKRLVVLAGDTHNAWHSNLTLMGLVPGGPPAGTKVGEEFATPSVSSPGLEEALTLPPQQIEAIFRGVVDDLRWIDASRRGFLKMTFTPFEAKGEWVFVNTVKSQTYAAAVGYTASYSA